MLETKKIYKIDGYCFKLYVIKKTLYSVLPSQCFSQLYGHHDSEHGAVDDEEEAVEDAHEQIPLLVVSAGVDGDG